MEKQNLKIIIQNLELWLDALKSEVYSDISVYKSKGEKPLHLDYDEIFEDDDD